jgi:hypothetical protein
MEYFPEGAEPQTQVLLDGPDFCFARAPGLVVPMTNATPMSTTTGRC